MISILFPFHNEANFIEECVQSIKNQSETNWELLAVDDFSTDDSYAIMEHFSSQDSRIKLFKNQKKGIIPALKLAFLESKGIFITRMDADDLMPTQKLEQLKARLIAAGKRHISTGFVSYFSKNELQNGFKKYELWLNKHTSDHMHFESIYKECVIASPAWMAFKSDLEVMKAFTESQYPEDYDLVFRWYKHGFTVVSVKEIVHLWRDHPSRASRNDPNYQDQGFTHLKTPYFLTVDRNPSKELFLWGAGRKAKAIAQSLLHENQTFRWVSNNKNKIGKDVYGVIIEASSALMEVKEKQVILAISDLTFQTQKHEEVVRFKIKSEDLYEFV